MFVHVEGNDRDDDIVGKLEGASVGDQTPEGIKKVASYLETYSWLIKWLATLLLCEVLVGCP